MVNNPSIIMNFMNMLVFQFTKKIVKLFDARDAKLKYYLFIQIKICIFTFTVLLYYCK